MHEQSVDRDVWEKSCCIKPSKFFLTNSHLTVDTNEKNIYSYRQLKLKYKAFFDMLKILQPNTQYNMHIPNDTGMNDKIYVHYLNIC